MERRLAAVLIADVAGYGRLSAADEEGTRARFQADLHEVFEPNIAAHHGRLVKTMGDGLLVEFHSVVDAVRCAVEVQRAKSEREAGIGADRRLAFRIGINLGDVIVEGDDLYGDGVNVAARLQALADPGGILAGLRGRGVRIAARDVGPGFAGLRHLSLLSPELARLDETLVRSLGQSFSSHSIVAAMVACASDVGARLIAPGVASEEQLHELRNLGVELVHDLASKTPAPGAATEVFYRCFERGLSFKISLGNVLTLSPPLIIGRAEMDQALEILEVAIDQVERSPARVSAGAACGPQLT
jgi:hypothetical protein